MARRISLACLVALLGIVLCAAVTYPVTAAPNTDSPRGEKPSPERSTGAQDMRQATSPRQTKPPAGPQVVTRPGSSTKHDERGEPKKPAAARQKKNPPNVVLIMMDDFSENLLRTMPAVNRLKKRSAYFTNAYVADSLCCTSRATTFTGQYPHNTGVRANTAGPDPANPVGGWAAFRKYGNLAKSFNVALNRRDARSYRTGFFGKYINGFPGKDGYRPPPGWSSWHSIGNRGYREWKYHMTRLERRDGDRVMARKYYGNARRDYATSVMQRGAAKFIRQRRNSSRPYFLEVSTYATHARNGPGAHKGDPRFPPAFADRPTKRDKDGNCGRVRCKSLDVRDLPGWNDDTRDNRPRYADGRPAPIWQPTERLDHKAAKKLTKHYRNRARMAQAVDRLVARVMRETGPNTYVVVTSDNGHHLGQHRMKRGKGTAYEHDIGVPLIVHGPGVDPGRRTQTVSNVDLAATFEDIAGVRSSVERDGRSFLPVLRSRKARGQRYAFVEHQRPPRSRFNPDAERTTGAVPSYIAVRSTRALLIRYDLNPDPGASEYAYEFYRRLGPNRAYERTNEYQPADPEVNELASRIARFDGCRGSSCRKAAR